MVISTLSHPQLELLSHSLLLRPSLLSLLLFGISVWVIRAMLIQILFVCPSLGHSCTLGKYVKLPFAISMSFSSCPFEIIHGDLWTSPILCPSSYKQYVLFLDDYTNFLWTFPSKHKSQVYDILVNIHHFIRSQFELEIKSFQCDHGDELNNNII